jgi:hypothetical protein
MGLADIISERRARRRDLRREELEVEGSTDETEAARYREALQRERTGVEQHLRRAESLAPTERVEVPFTAPHEWPSAGALVADLRARLAGIDAEIKRASG